MLDGAQVIATLLMIMFRASWYGLRVVFIG